MESVPLGTLELLLISSFIISILEIRTAWLYFRNGKSVLRPSYYPAVWLTLIFRGRSEMNEMKQRLLKDPKKHAISAIIYSVGWLIILVSAIAGIILKTQNK